MASGLEEQPPGDPGGEDPGTGFEDGPFDPVGPPGGYQGAGESGGQAGQHRCRSSTGQEGYQDEREDRVQPPQAVQVEGGGSRQCGQGNQEESQPPRVQGAERQFMPDRRRSQKYDRKEKDPDIFRCRRRTDPGGLPRGNGCTVRHPWNFPPALPGVIVGDNRPERRRPNARDGAQEAPGARILSRGSRKKHRFRNPSDQGKSLKDSYMDVIVLQECIIASLRFDSLTSL